MPRGEASKERKLVQGWAA